MSTDNKNKLTRALFGTKNGNLLAVVTSTQGTTVRTVRRWELRSKRLYLTLVAIHCLTAEVTFNKSQSNQEVRDYHKDCAALTKKIVRMISLLVGYLCNYWYVWRNKKFPNVVLPWGKSWHVYSYVVWIESEFIFPRHERNKNYCQILSNRRI